MAVRMTKVVLIGMREKKYTITRTILATERINRIVITKFRI